MKYMKGRGWERMTFKKIVCMGDSITEGFGVDQKESYPAVLAKRNCLFPVTGRFLQISET